MSNNINFFETHEKEKLLENGRLRDKGHCENEENDVLLPVVKLFTPDANCVWLLSELNPDNQDIAFGLCDLGMGYPDFGKVLLSELASIRGPEGLRVVRDPSFKPTKTLKEYEEEARAKGRIEA